MTSYLDDAGDWVEVEDDDHVLARRAEPLRQVVAVDYSDLTVTLDSAPAPVSALRHPGCGVGPEGEQAGTPRARRDAATGGEDGVRRLGASGPRGRGAVRTCSR